MKLPFDLPIEHARDILSSIAEHSPEADHAPEKFLSNQKQIILEQVIHDSPLNVTTKVITQHWGGPYDSDYILIRPEWGMFKDLDYLVVSSKAEPSVEDLAACNEQMLLDVVRPISLLNVHKTEWLTKVTTTQLKTAGKLYLIALFPMRQGTAVAYTTRICGEIDAAATYEKLAGVEVEGKAPRPHPRISPEEVSKMACKHSESVDPVIVSASTDAEVLAGAEAAPPVEMFLTVSSTTGWKHYYLQVNAYVIVGGPPPEAFDYIGLSDQKPQRKNPLVVAGQYVNEFVAPDFQLVTSVAVEDDDAVSVNALTKYWLFYGRIYSDGSNRIVGNPVQFTPRSSWMKDRMNEIGDKKLHQILIPGSHDAGCYKGVEFSPTSKAQSLDFKNQLLSGIRYFDCRVWYFPDNTTDKWWFYHGASNTKVPLSDLLTALENFFRGIGNSEIVILEFSHFGDNVGMPEYVELFDKRMRNLLLGAGINLVPKADVYTKTIRELVAEKKQILFCTPSTYLGMREHVLGPINLDSEWADTDDIDVLRRKLQIQVDQHSDSNKLWGLQAILTPQAKLLKSLGTLADVVNPRISQWAQFEWQGKLNIVMTDFCLGNSIANLAANAFPSDSRWHYVAGESGWMSDADDWNQPEYYETIQALTVGELFYVTVRSAAGLEAHWRLPTTSEWGSRPILDIFSDALGWKPPEFYETMQTVAVGATLYVIARGFEGMFVYRWDHNLGWGNLPRIPSFSNQNQWDQPGYYKTIQAVAVGEMLYVMGRSPAGLEVYWWLPPTSSWGQRPLLDTLSDAHGWNHPQFYETIQAVAVGAVLYVIARGSDGMFVYRWDSSQGWVQLPSIPSFSDQNHWDQPGYYKTIQAIAVGEILYVMGRGPSGLEVYWLLPTSSGWVQLSILDTFSDAHGWNHPQFYETIQAVAVGAVLYVMGRGIAGMYVYRLDANMSWVSVPNAPRWSDGEGWARPECYKTIQGLSVSNRLCLMGRSPSGYAGHIAE